MRSKTFKLVLLAVVAALATALTLTAASGAKSDKRGKDHGKASKTLKANLNGENEVDANGVRGQGDPDGKGRAVVKLLPQFGAICWKLQWENIAAPTRAHIHQAAKDVNGPIVVEFVEPPETFPANVSQHRGCTDNLSVELIRDIKRNPSGFYVNIHNAEFPAGAIRGQLKRSGRGRGHKRGHDH